MGGELERLLGSRRLPADRLSVDVGRMQRERHARLQAEMARRSVDVAVLLHGPNVAYATGLTSAGVDAGHATYRRPAAVVVSGEPRPHLYWDADVGLGLGLDGHGLDVEVRPALWPELDDGVAGLAAALVGRSAVAVDEMTGAMLRAGVVDPAAVVDAGALVAAAKLTKTADELACIDLAQRRNETAMVAAQAAARPGVRRSVVAGAFLAELGATNLIDPIFQPMPRRIVDGPRTTTGGVAFPTGDDDPLLCDGDLLWVDSGIDHLGFASDFGRTWIVGRDPTPDEQALFARWCSVMLAVLDVLRPGASAGDLCAAATATATAAEGSSRPWLPHFYLAHGLGVESAEMPLVGTDLGLSFDDGLILAPGMVLVLEPVVWEDGVGGYRAEEIVAVTDDGWRHLGGGHTYAPFGP